MEVPGLYYSIEHIRVAELNKRCQGGDEAACKEGLAAASKTLDLIVEAMEGNYDD